MGFKLDKMSFSTNGGCPGKMRLGDNRNTSQVCTQLATSCSQTTWNLGFCLPRNEIGFRLSDYLEELRHGALYFVREIDEQSV